MTYSQGGLPQIRRSQARGERTRERLLVAARRLFADAGYEGASIGDVAREAGVGVGTVYHHFADKRALLIALLEEFEIRGLQADDDLGGLGLALEARDARHGLRAMVRVAVDLLHKRPSVFAMGEELARRDAEVAASCRRIEDAMRGRLRRAIEHGQASGKIRPDVDPQAGAFLLFETSCRVLPRIADQPGGVDAEPLIAECAEMLGRYLLV